MSLTHVSSAAAIHKWEFLRTGGIGLVILQSGLDLLNLEHLDQ